MLAESGITYAEPRAEDSKAATLVRPRIVTASSTLEANLLTFEMVLKSEEMAAWCPPHPAHKHLVS